MFCRTCFPKGNGSVLLKVSPEFATWSRIHQPDQDDSKVVPDRRVVHVPGSLDWGSQVASSGNFRQTGSGSCFDRVKSQSRREESTKPDGAVNRHLAGQGLWPN